MGFLKSLLLVAAVEGTAGVCPAPTLVRSSIGSITVKVPSVPSDARSCRVFRDDCAGGPMQEIFTGDCGAEVVSLNLVIDGNCRFSCQAISQGGQLGVMGDTVTFAAAGPPSFTGSVMQFTKFGANCVNVAWPSPDIQGSPVFCYSVRRDAEDNAWVTVRACANNADQRSQVVCGLEADSSYRIAVFASNRVGTTAIPLMLSFSLKNMQATPQSAALSPATAVMAGQPSIVTVQAVDPVSGLDETASLQRTGYPSRVFVARLLNPSKFDETGWLEIPLGVDDVGYSEQVPYVKDVDKPITVVSQDTDNGQYVMNYVASKAGQYSLVVRSLESGGLYGQYWDNQWFFGLPLDSHIDPSIDFDWGRGSLVAFASDFVSIRWTGFVLATFSEEYTFYLEADDNVKLWIDDVLIIDKWQGVCCGEFWGVADLTANMYHHIRIDYRELTDSAYVRLFWSSFSQAKTRIPAAALFSAPEIKNMPVAVEIQVGNLDATKSAVFGPNLLETVAGQMSVVYVQGRDTQGNNLTSTATPFVATFTQALFAQVTVVSTAADPKVQNGLQAFYFTLTKSGSYTLSVSSGNTAVRDQPFLMRVLPAVPAAIKSKISAGFPLDLTTDFTFEAGEQKTLELSLRDVFDNEVDGATIDSTDISLTLNWRHFVQTSDIALVDDSNELTRRFGEYFFGSASYAGQGGRFNLVFTSFRAGNSQLTIKLAGVNNIAGSPFSILGRHSAIVSGVMSVYRASDPPATATAGSSFAAKIQLRDAYGNIVTQVADGTTVQIRVGPQPFDTGACVHAGNGVYSCSAVPRKGGAVNSRWLSILVNDQEVSRIDAATGKTVAGPFPIRIEPGTAAGGLSTVATSDKSMWRLYTGQYIDVLLVLKDQYGNLLSDSSAGREFNENVVAKLNGESLQIVNNLNGTYTLKYGARGDGNNVVFECTVDGADCGNAAQITDLGIDILTSPASSRGTTCALPLEYVAGVAEEWLCTPRDVYQNEVNFADLFLLVEYYPLVEETDQLTQVLSFNMSYSSQGTGQYRVRTQLDKVGDYSSAVYLAEVGGLFAEYFRNDDFNSLVYGDQDPRHTEMFAFTRIDSVVDFESASADTRKHMNVQSMPRDFWSVRWSGWLLPKVSGLHSVYVEADMGVRLTVNGQILLNMLDVEVAVNASGRVDLEVHVPVPITLEYRHATSESYISLSWSSGDFHQEIIPAVNLLAARDTLDSSQRQVVVVPDEVGWTTSQAMGGALHVMTAGVQQQFTFLAYDKYGNKRGAVSSRSLRAYVDSVPNRAYGAFAYSTNGDYTVTITPEKTGEWPLFVQIFDADSQTWQSIVNSPFSVQILPGAVVPGNTLIEGAGQEEGRAGDRTCFRVTLTDSNRNNVYGNGDNTQFDHEAMQPSVVAGTVEYLGSGVYQVCYVWEITGVWTDLKISVGSTEIPFSIRILPGLIRPDGEYDFNLNVPVPGTSANAEVPTLLAGESNVMRLVARDAHGNEVNDDPDLGVSCTARGQQVAGVARLSVAEQAAGVWDLDVQVPDSGTWKLDCRVARRGGLNAKYYGNSRWLGPASEYIEPEVCVDWGQGLVGPGLTEEASAIWDGLLKVPFTCDWKLKLQVSGGGRAYVWIDGERIGEGDYRGPDQTSGGSGGEKVMHLTATRMVPVQLVFWNDVNVGLGGGVCLKWSCQSSAYSERTIPKEHLYHSQTRLKNFRPSDAATVTVVKPATVVQALYRLQPYQTKSYTAVWWPPVDTGGLTVTGYRVRTKRPLVDWSDPVVLTADQLSLLRNTEFFDVQYQFEVTAITRFIDRSEDLIGDAQILQVFPCVLPNKPGPPQLHGASATLGFLEFALEAPVTSGCVVGMPVPQMWEIAWNEGYGEDNLRSRQSGSVAGGATDAIGRVTNLVLGRSYKFSQRWRTEIGWSAWSTVATFKCCEWVLPSAVRNVRRDPSLPQAVEQISVSWDAPEFSGSTSVFFYRIYYSNGVVENYKDTVDAMLQSYTLTGAFLYEDSADLIWRFQVTAVNAVGEGSRSKRITLLAVDPPHAPTQPISRGGWVFESSVTRIGIQWDAPVGSKITGYRVYVNDGQGGSDLETVACDLSGQSSALSCVFEPVDADTGITQLVAGNQYLFQIVPLNEAGEGERTAVFEAFAASRPSEPGRPTPNIVSSSTSLIVVTWTAPQSDGGKPISSYTVERQVVQGGVASWQVVEANISAFGTLECRDANVASFGVYRYRVYALNGVTVGNIKYSNEAQLVASAPLGAPAVTFADSTETSISIEWTPPSIPAGAESVLAVTGYKVYVNSQLTYDGSGIPAVRQFILPQCEEGQWLDIKVTALSIAGESAQSDCCTKPCARRPYQISDPPHLIASSKTGIKIGWMPPANNGGLPLTGYVVQRAVAANAWVWMNVGSLDSDVLEFADTTVTAGLTYRYRVYAMNEVNGLASCDTSAFSQCDADASGYREYRACATSAAPVLTRPVGDSSSQMQLEWSPVDDSISNGGCVATGYRIYSNDGLDGPVDQLVYDGSQAASVLNFQYLNLTAGRLYWLQATTLSQAGEGDKSNIFEFYAAKTPGKVTGLKYAQDRRTDGGAATDTQIAIQWDVPSDTGGGAIVMWEIVHDGGDATAADLIVKQFVCDPDSAALTIAGAGVTAGKYFRVSVRAHGRCLDNAAAVNDNAVAPCPYTCSVPGVFSETVTFVAAAFPTSFSITADPDLRTRSSVGVVWTPCSDAVVANCVTSKDIPLLRFDLYKDDCNGGDFNLVGSIAPTDFQFVFTQNRANLPPSSQGLCGFYVEAVNARGRATSLETIYEFLVGAPAKPAMPVRLASSQSAIQLGFTLPGDTGGASITQIRVYRDDPVNGNFQINNLLTTLNYDVLTYTDTAVSSGEVYRYQVVMVNAEDLQSARSDAALMVAASKPAAPAVPTLIAKSKTSATVSWNVPTNEGGAQVTRFAVYRASSLAGTMVEVYRGSGVSTLFQLDTNVAYNFRVSAINAAGEGDKSDPLIVRTVESPSAPGIPVITSSDCSTNSLTLSWDSVEDQGGCPVEAYLIYVDGVLADTLALDGTYALHNAFTFTDKQCDKVTPWLFQIKARNCDSLSEFSQGLTSRNADLPGVVAGLQAAFIDSETLRYSWNALPSQTSPAFRGYKLYVDDGRGGPVTLAFDGVNKPDTTSADVDQLIAGRSYRAFAVGVNEVAESDEGALVLETLFGYTASAPVNVVAVYESAACVKLTWAAPSDTGGVGLTGYEVQYAPGPAFDTFVVATLSPNVVATVRTSVCGLMSGTQYQFRVRAINEVNLQGVWSTLIARTAGALPDTPLNLHRLSSTTSSILFEWSPLLEAAYGGGSVVGYKLYLNQGLNDRLTLVYNGQHSPNVVSFNATNLVCGRTYTVKVSAVSEIGEGQATALVQVPMFVAPSRPMQVAVSESSPAKIKLTWSIPQNTGCFEVANYKVERDCGNSGDFDVMANQVTTLFYEDTSVPSAGVMCVYRVAASNQALVTEFGEYSTYISGYFAGLPGAVTGVSLEATSKVACRLAFSAPTSDGGVAVTFYEMQADDGLGGEYVSKTNATALVDSISGLTTGRNYRVRVAAWNPAGRGPWSVVSTECTAADLPDAPMSFRVSSLSATSFEAQWKEPSNDGGSLMLEYEVWTKTGDETQLPVISIVNSATSRKTLSCTTNLVYEVKVRVRTQVGWGTYSQSVYHLCDEVPASPLNLRLSEAEMSTELEVTDLRSPSSIMVSWDASADDAVVVRYNLYVDDGQGNGIYQQVFSGKQYSAKVPGLVRGRVYRFTVSAVSQAGEGARSSPPLSIPMFCVPFAPPSAPVLKSRSEWDVAIEWQASSDACGASITGYRVYRDNSLIFPVSNYFIHGGQLTVTALGVSSVAFTLTPGRDGQVWAILSEMSERTRFDIVNAVYALEGDSCRIKAHPVTANMQLVTSLTNCAMESGSIYYIHVYLEGVNARDYDGAQAVVVALAPQEVPDDTRTNTFVTSPGPGLSATATTDLIKVKFAVASAGVVSGVVALAGADLSVADVLVGGGGAGVGATTVIESVVSVAATVTELEFHGPFAAGNVYEVYLYVASNPGDSDGDLVKITAQVSVYLSNTFALSPRLTSAATSDGFTVRFTASAAIGRLWIFLTNEAGKDDVTEVSARLTRNSVGGNACKQANADISASQNDLVLSRCGLRAGDTYYMHVYIEGTHGPAGPSSEADGSLWVPVEVLVPAVAQSALTDTTADLWYIDAEVQKGAYHTYNVRPVSTVGVGFPSVASLEILAAGDPSTPGAPLNPSRAQTSAYLQWGAPHDGGSTIVEYILQMAEVLNGDQIVADSWVTVYVGAGESHVQAELLHGKKYAFRVAARSYGGTSDFSDASYVYACAPPSVPVELSVSSRSTTGLTFNWLPPVSDGGCDNVEYIVKFDDVEYSNIEGTSWSSVSLLQAGSTHHVAVRASSFGGLSAWTMTHSVIAANAPDEVAKPQVTSHDKTGITISWLAPSSNGGSAITGYRVFQDDGLGGDAFLLAGFVQTTTFTSAANVVEGRQYCFKVSAENAASYSDVPATMASLLAARSRESDEVCEYAAQVPSVVRQVLLRRVEARQIIVDWVTPVTDNGSVIVYYEVYGKSEFQGNNFDLVATTSAGYTQAVYEGCTVGALYTFRVRAKNAVGFGPFAADVAGKCAVPPSSPLDLTRTASSMTSATLTWAASEEANGAAITRYSLYYELGMAGAKTRVYSGTSLTFVHSPLVTGVTYTYFVTASNEAGESLPSAPVEVLAATVPGRPSNLRIVSRTRTTMVFGWNSPSSDGGTPITYYELYYGTTTDEISTMAWRGLALNSANVTFIEGTMYYFQVAACNAVTSQLGGCTRDTSDLATKLSSYAAEVPPEIPTLYLKESSLSSIKVAWDSTVSDTGAAGMLLVGFKLYADNARGGPIDKLICETGVPAADDPDKEVSCLRTALAGGMTFRYQLVVVNPVGDSARGPATEFRTCEIPYAPVVFEVSNRTIGVVNVTWSQVPLTTCPITSYQLLSRRELPTSEDDCNSVDAAYDVIGETTGSSFLFNPGVVQVYCLKVRGQNWQTLHSAVTGQSSTVIFVKSATAPSPPVSVSRLTSGRTSITVSWSLPVSNGGASIDGYEISHDDGLGGAFSETTVVLNDGLATDGTISGLAEGRLYGVRVRGLNDVNRNNPLTDNSDCCWSQVVYLWTAEVPCQPLVETLAVHDPSRVDTGFTIRWAFTQDRKTCSFTADLPVTGYVVWRSKGKNLVDPSDLLSSEDETLTELVADYSKFPNTLSHVFTGMSPGFQYIIGVTAVNDVGESVKDQSVGRTTVVCCTTPSQPGNVLVKPANGVDSSLFKVSWDAPPASVNNPVIGLTLFRDDGALGQIVQLGSELKDETILSFRLLEVTDPNDPRVNSEGETYRFQLAASNRVGMGERSPIFAFQACKKPSPPEDVSMQDFADDAVTLVWLPSSDPGGTGCFITKYVVKRVGPGGQETVECETSAQSRLCRAVGLEAGMYYSFRITAFNQPDESEPVSFPSEGTFSASAPPSAPGKLQFVSATSDQQNPEISIKWERPLSSIEIDSYDVLVKRCELPGDGELAEGVQFNQVAGQNQDQVTINKVMYDSLMIKKSICVQVRAQNANAVGPWSPSGIFIASPVPNTPRSITVNGKTQEPLRFVHSTRTSLEVQWNAVTAQETEAAITSYRLTYFNAFVSPNDEVVVLVDSGKTSYTLTSGLAAGDVFTLRVAACNLNGCSADTGLLTLVVGDLPEPPTDLRRVTSDNDKLTIAWTYDAARDNGGVTVKQFVLQRWSPNEDIFEDFATVESSESTYVYTYSETEKKSAVLIRVGVSTGVGSPRGANLPTAFSSELTIYCAARPTKPSSAPTVSVLNGNSLRVSLYSPSSTELQEIGFRGWQIFLQDLDDGQSASFRQIDVYDPLAVYHWTTSDVLVGHTYQVKLRVCSLGSCSADSSVSAGVRIARAPDAPSSVFSEDTTNSNIVIGWTHTGSTGGAEITAWNVYLSRDGLQYSANDMQTIVNSEVSPTRQFSFDCTSINRGRMYLWWRVAAVNVAGEGEKSAVFTRRCSSAPDPMDAPSLVLGTTSAITVGWSVPDSDTVLFNANHLGYSLCWRNADLNGDFTCEAINDSATTRFTLTNSVVAGNNFEFEVAAVSEVGTGIYSPVLTVPAANKPRKITGLQRVGIQTGDTGNSRKLSISWSDVGIDGGAALTAFTVYTSTDFWATKTSSAVLASVTSFEFACSTSPIPQFVYFKVTATNAIGEGPESDVLKLRCCLAPESPEAPVRVTAGESSVRVGFNFRNKNADGCDMVGWKLSVGDGNDGELSVIDIQSPAAREYLFSTLVGGGPVYNFKIKAISEGGESDWSPTSAIEAANVPGNPADVGVVSTSNTEVVVSWNPQGSGGSAITAFRLYVSRDCVNWETPHAVAASPSDTQAEISCATVPGTDILGAAVTMDYTQHEMCVLVTAVNSVGESATREEAFFGADWIMTRCSAVPQAPSGTDLPSANYDGENDSGSEMLVTWSQPGLSRTNQAVYYGVVIELDDQITYPAIRIFVDETSLTSKRIAGLTAGLQYRVSYAWRSSVGEGQMSNPVELLAAGKAQKPYNVGRIGFDASAQTLQIQWSYVGQSTNGGTVTSWSVRYARVTSTQSVSQEHFTNEISVGSDYSTVTATISCDSTPVTAFRQYLYVAVAAVTHGVGEGTYSDYVTLWCGESPGTLTISELVASTDETHIAVQWQTSEAQTFGAPIQGFKIYKGDTSDNLVSVQETLETSTSQFVISGVSGPSEVTTGSRYFIAVRLVTAAGESANSNVVAVYACRHPEAKRPTRDSSRSSAVQSMMVWAAATQQGCPVVGYRLFNKPSTASQYSSVFPAGTPTSVTDPYDASLANSLVLEAASSCTGVVGLTVYYKVRVYSPKGYVDSTESWSYCAGVPAQMAAPVQVGSLSSDPNAIQLTWVRPNLNGGQLVRYNLYIDGVLFASCDVVLSCVVTSKIMGEKYEAEIAAVTDFGEGPRSDPILTTAATLPDVPTAATVTAASSAPSITFSWTAPSANGLPVTKYGFVVKEDGVVKPAFDGVTGSPPSTTLTLTSSTSLAVAAGKQYQLCVQAVTDIGRTSCSVYSSTTGFAGGYTLSIPTFDNSASISRHSDTPASGTVKVAWSSVNNMGGDSSVSYQVKGVTSSPATEADQLGLVFTTSLLHYSFTVPAGQVWLFSVRATNRRGDFSDYVGPVSLRSCSPPLAPSNLVVLFDSSTFSVSWAAPSDNGGAAILNYRVYQDNTAISPDLDSDTLTLIVNRDANLASSTFEVSGINDCGEGAKAAFILQSLT